MVLPPKVLTEGRQPATPRFVTSRPVLRTRTRMASATIRQIDGRLTSVGKWTSPRIDREMGPRRNQRARHPSDAPEDHGDGPASTTSWDTADRRAGVPRIHIGKRGRQCPPLSGTRAQRHPGCRPMGSCHRDYSRGRGTGGGSWARPPARGDGPCLTRPPPSGAGAGGVAQIF